MQCFAEPFVSHSLLLVFVMLISKSVSLTGILSILISAIVSIYNKKWPRCNQMVANGCFIKFLMCERKLRNFSCIKT